MVTHQGTGGTAVDLFVGRRVLNACVSVGGVCESAQSIPSPWLHTVQLAENSTQEPFGQAVKPKGHEAVAACAVAVDDDRDAINTNKHAAARKELGWVIVSCRCAVREVLHWSLDRVQTENVASVKYVLFLCCSLPQMARPKRCDPNVNT